MRTHLARTLTISFIMCLLAAIPSRAQVTSYVDDQGNLVFTNLTYPNTAPEAPKATNSRSATAPATNTATAKPALIPAKPAPAELDSLVQQTAEKHHVDPNLVRAVISTESNWNASAVSSKGAKGLMQLVPETAQKLGVGNAFDPAQNVDGGVRYLGMLLERYNGDLNKALAAYNAGPGLVDRLGGVPNLRETRDYVKKVKATYLGSGPASLGSRSASLGAGPASLGAGAAPLGSGTAHLGPSLEATGLDAQAPPPPIEPAIYRSVQDGGRIVFTNE
jgi:soluble lytic murein transglycosylase-like protein